MSKPSLKGCDPIGCNLTYQVDISYPLALVKAVFRLGGQKTQLDCSPRGLDSDTTGLYEHSQGYSRLVTMYFFVIVTARS